MAIGLKYSTVPSQDNKTRTSDIKGNRSSVEFPTNGLKYLLGVGYDTGDDTAIPYLVSTKNIPMSGDIPQASSFDIAQLSDQGGLRNTWSNKQDALTAGSHITINNNTISSNYSASDFDISQLADQGGLRTTWSGKQDTFTVSQPLSMSDNNLSINLSNYATTTSVNNIDITITAAKEPSSISDNNIQMIYKGTVDNNSVPIAYVPYTNSSAQTYSKEYYATSDKSLKENVTEVTPDNNIFNVPIVEFNWKDTKAKSIGVIAQDLEKVAPVAVSTSDSGMKSVNYTTFLLLRIAALEDKINKLEDKVNELSK